MDLVHKEDIVLLQVCQQRREVAGLLNGRAGGDAHVDAHLVGDDGGQRGLAEARRAGKQNVVKGFVPELRRLDKDLQILLGLLLSHIFVQITRTQRNLGRVLRLNRGAGQDLFKAVVGKTDTHVTSPFASIPF